MFTLAIRPPSGRIKVSPFPQPKFSDFLGSRWNPSEGFTRAFLAFGLRQSSSSARATRHFHVIFVIGERVHAEATRFGISDALAVKVGAVHAPTHVDARFEGASRRIHFRLEHVFEHRRELFAVHRPRHGNHVGIFSRFDPTNRV